MKKSSFKNLVLSIFASILLVGSLSASFNENKVDASTPIKEVYAYNTMVGNSASISGNDVTPMNSGNQLVTYGFRKGSVSQNNINQFEDYNDNLLGTTNKQEAFFENWRIRSINGDGAIIYFKAHQKVNIIAERKKLGNDWLDGSVLNIYKNNVLLKTTTLYNSSAESDDFYVSVTLEENDNFYYEFITTTPDERLIQMDAAGADWSTLPVFTVQEYVQTTSDTITLEHLVNNGSTLSTSTSFMVDYKVYNGSRFDNSLIDAFKNDNKVGNSNSYISNNGLHINQLSPLTIYVKANQEGALKIAYTNNQEDYTDLIITSYQYITNKSATKKMFEIKNTIENSDGYFILEEGDYLYLEYKSLSNNDVTAFESILVESHNMYSPIKSSYPLYDLTDYSARDSLTHKEIVFESARNNNENIVAKDFTIALLAGSVSEEDGEDLSKYSYVEYEDGFYLEKTVSPKVLLTSGEATFDGKNYASVEDYRLKTSVSAANVYKIVAKNDIRLSVTHPATTGGWIDENGLTYIAGYQTNGEVIKLINRHEVINGINDENAFAINFDLKANDVAYYVFGTEVAEQRNLNIAPVFTSNASEYDADNRDDLFGTKQLSVPYEQIVTDTINNSYQPVIYKDIVSISFKHGNVEEQKLFESHLGNGMGGPDDMLITNSGANEEAHYKRWQMHAGLLGDDLIMEFKVLKDSKFLLNIPRIDIIENEGASLKYYISDTDGFIEFKEERPIMKDRENNYYGYDASLKENQSLLVVYSANDENGFGVIGTTSATESLFTANVLVDEFNIDDVNDFTNARELESHKELKTTDLANYIASLNTSDYSISNYGLIESYFDEFVKGIKTLTTIEEVDELYNETILLIDDVLTIEEENEILEDHRQDVKAQARQYMDERRDMFTDDEWLAAEDLYNTFCMTVDLLISETEIKLELQRFKNAFDLLPHTGGELPPSSEPSSEPEEPSSETPSSEPSQEPPHSSTPSSEPQGNEPINNNDNSLIIVLVVVGGVVLVALSVSITVIVLKRKK